jgi:hypothetical protein
MKVLGCLVFLITFNSQAASSFLSCSGDLFSYGHKEGTIIYDFKDSLEINIEEGYFKISHFKFPLRHATDSKLETDSAHDLSKDLNFAKLDRFTGEFAGFLRAPGSQRHADKFLQLKCKKAAKVI